MSETIVILGGSEIALRVEKEGERHRVRTADGREVEVEIVSVREGVAELRLNGRMVMVPFALGGERVELMLDGEIRRAAASSGARRPGRGHSDHSLSAPMPGQVLKIFVEVGDVVAKGEALMVLEAMKMEHQIVAPWDGRVESIACAAGEMVQPGVDLIAIAPEEGE
ncbi:MAG TPA: biotin/lipoyl-containing protein [Thermoanaerobaculia bacterium]|nr:biotin/lipoyl-containing protein [Thermoanaerobaculia bacterium]